MSLAPAVVNFDPLRDRSYRNARLGPDVAAFLAWFELGGASHESLDSYERSLAVACKLYPLTPLEEWTGDMLLQVAKRMPQMSRKTRMAPFSTFFKWARQTRRITVNPMEELPTFKRPKPKPKDVFTDAEIELLLGLPIVDSAPMGLLLEAGLRRAEAIGMLLRRCRPGSGKVVVLDGKGGKDRVVPQSARLAALLADLELLEAVGPDDHVFYGVKANGQGARRVLRRDPIGEGTFARWWRRCLDTAGVRYRNPHTTRHTFATRWKRRGLPAEDLAVVMGHESVQTTIDLYFHIEADEVAGRMALIEAGLDQDD